MLGVFYKLVGESAKSTGEETEKGLFRFLKLNTNFYFL